jgi:Winged helix DNA-binding domain
MAHGQSVALLAKDRLSQTRSNPPAAPPRKIATNSPLSRFGKTRVGTTLEHTCPTMIAERLTAQLLTGTPAHDPVTVAERLLAIQGQDPRGARLAIRARTTGLFAADVDRALTEDRSLLITWLNRGTLHLVRSEDYPWLHAVTTPPLRAANARRLAQEGVTPAAAERGVAAIAHSLTEEGPLTRVQLRERIEMAGVRTEGQALVHLLMLACLGGVAVRGPMIGRAHAYVLVRDWLGESAPVDRDRALAELARRYLVGHGPADDRDLAKWAGLPLRDVRAGLSAIAAELCESADGLLDIAGREAPAELPPPRLLGPFDPILLGWVSREWLLDSHKAVITVNGLFRPFALIDAGAVATWSMPGGKVVLAPFDRLTRENAAALEADAQDVVRYMGDR